MITNKTEFLIYRILLLISFIIIILFILQIAIRIAEFDAVKFSNNTFEVLKLLSLLVMIFLIATERIKPAFIQFNQTENGIVIKTYRPNPNSWKSLFNLFVNKNETTEYKISKDEFSDYQLKVRYMGLLKELIFRKTNIDGIYQSANINISLLGSPKYTNLIQSLDKLRTKTA
jgi:uncharacterized membrane protein YidH (DUF202 family)